MRRILLRVLAALARRLKSGVDRAPARRYEEDPDLIALLRPLNALVREHPAPFHELALRTFPAIDVEGAPAVLYDVSDQATIRWLWQARLRQRVAEGRARHPVVVDLGANDGLVGSMSLNLIQLGWHAILVEPLTEMLDMARRNVAHYLRPGQAVHLLGLALGEADGVGLFETESEQDIARMEGHLTASRSSTTREVPVVSPERFLEGAEVRATLAAADLVVLSLDIEGVETMVLRRLLAAGLAPDFVIIEHLRDAEAQRELLESHGYEWIHRVRFNDLYERRPQGAGEVVDSG